MADYIHPDSIEYKLNLGRVPPEPQEGVIWRGMSGGEYKNLLEQGFLESKGDYNIGEIQKGLTIFSSNPRTAEMYAHDFAPREFKATPESSAYVVGIRKPSGAVPQTQKNPSEFGVTGQIPIEDIVSVYRGNVFRPRSDRQRAVLDWQEMSLPERRLPQDEPRSTDLVEQRPGLPRLTGIGQAFRGIGSMIGGPKLRAVRKLITMAQQGYELLPEEQKLLGDVLDMEALTKPIPGTGRGLEYFRQLLGMKPRSLEEAYPDLREKLGLYEDEQGGITSLPMDEASRMARAGEQKFDIDTYHATRDDFTTFEKGDLGYHFGTKEHANNRLERTREKTLSHPDGDYTRENILPTKIRLTNPLELPDVGDWKDPMTIAASALRPSRVTGYSGEWGKAHEEELTEIIDTVRDYFDDFKFADKKEFKESPEAAELVEQIRDMIIEDGYDGVKYYNVAEADFNEEGNLILEHSYIVFDPKNIRSRFAEFDPAQSESPEISKAAGGFIDKPLYGRA